MRIISGSAKGRKLNAPPGRSMQIRPTSDRAREALFSILGARVKDSRVLDLFAGTGALGCEALSRGARSVVFVDNSALSLTLIKKNISLIPNGVEQSTVIKHNLMKSLSFSTHGAPALAPFDLVFADPPYQKGFTEKILGFLDKSIVLSENVLIVIEEKKNVVLDMHLENLYLDMRRLSGDTCFHFFIRKNKSIQNSQETS